MTIEAVSAVNSIALVPKTELGTSVSEINSSNSFFNMIGEKLNNIDESIKQSDGLIHAYVKGESIPVHEIMVALGKAKTEVQLAVEIRNKLLESYQEITRIQL